MMRRIVLLACCLLFLFPVHAFANEGILGDAIAEMSEEKPGIFERTVAGLIIDPANWILNLLGMTDPVILVFGKNPSADESGFLQGSCAGRNECSDGLVLGVFESGLMDAIDALYQAFERFTPFPLVIALLLIAVLLLFHGASAEGRSRAKDYMVAFLIGVAALRFGYYLWVFAAKVIQTFTELIWSTMMDRGIEPSLFLEMFWGTRDGYAQNLSMKSLGLAVLVLIAAFMVIAINYQYTVRKIMLMVLLVLFPVICVLTVFPKFRHSMPTWWDEFLSNLVLPAAHALALGLFFLMMHFSSTSASIWLIIVYMFALPAIAVLVRKLVGVEDSAGGVWGAMLGIAGLAGLMSLTKMMRPRGGKPGKESGGSAVATEGGTKAGSSLVKAGGDGGDGSAAGVSGVTAAVGASGSNWRGFATKTVSYGGKAAGYGLRFAGVAAGGVIGYTAGVMTGNPGMAAAGAMIGGSLGRKTVDWTGKGAAWAGKGAVWAGKKAAPVVSHTAQTVKQAVGQRLAPQVSGQEKSVPGSTENPIRIHFPDNYQPSGEEFWKNANLSNRYKREYVAELINNQKMQRHNELEQTFLKRNRDYYV
jgi:hypothetical protein